MYDFFQYSILIVEPGPQDHSGEQESMGGEAEAAKSHLTVSFDGLPAVFCISLTSL